MTDDEVARRRAMGLANRPAPPATRSYLEIVRENVFTFINDVLFVLAAALVLVGRPLDGIVSLGVISTNIVVGVFQEVRAKRVLDAIALLERPRARVVRGGRERKVPPEELVLGDIVAIGPGDQVILDGRLVVGDVEVDESLLTGESDSVRRVPGDPVCSATYCLSGAGHYEVTAVADASLANRIVATGKRFRRVLTPLQREVNLVVRVVLAVVVYLQVVLVIDAVVEQVPVPEAIGQATILAGLVPNGLFVAIAITYAAAAVRIARMGAVVQQANAIESLSHVDTLCLDKTGTLTANRLELETIEPWPPDGDDRDLRDWLGAVVAGAALRNRTAEAIAAACPAESPPVVADVPFSSARRWSGVAFHPFGSVPGGAFVLGAPSVLVPALSVADQAVVAGLEARVHEWTSRGRRVLLFARSADVQAFGTNRDPPLPRALAPLGLVVLRDVLRDGLTDTLERFERAGVRLRIISGDDPETVAALVRQAGLRVEGGAPVSGADLEPLEGAAFATAVERASIFGRITPTLKERIVDALKASGRYVAMVGDGVNDVLSLKRANLAVAMGSGSQATRGVADIILLDDSFSSLVRAVEEGHRILNGMQAVLELFLTRIATLGIIIMSSLVVEYFPVELRNASAITLFTVGIPSVLLALWAGIGRPPSRSLGRMLLRFTAPAAIVSSLAGLVVFYGTLFASGLDGQPPGDQQLAMARSALTAFLVVSGIGLVLFAAPPTRWFAIVEPPTGDARSAWLAALLLAGFGAVLVAPGGRTLFDLAQLDAPVVALVAIVLTAWLVLLRATWRHHLLERLVDAPAGR